MSEEYKNQCRVYVLSDESTIAFSKKAHAYVNQEYGALDLHFKRQNIANKLIADLKNDQFLKVEEMDNGNYRVTANNVPPQFKRQNAIPIAGLELALTAVDMHRDKDFEDANLPEGIGAINWQ